MLLKRVKTKKSILIFASTTIVLLCFLGVALIIAQNEKGKNFRYDKTVGPRKIFHRVIKQAGLFGTWFSTCSPDREVRIRLPSGFEIPISIYDRGGPHERSGIVLVHGNTWLGRNLSTYRLLASLLARKGYIVLTFDKVGFGESDDPFGQGPSAVAAAWNKSGQTNAVFQYLIENTPVDRHDLSIIGHSGGVDQALEVGLAREDISRIVIMVAPPVRLKDGSEPPNRSAYFSNRFKDTYSFIYGRDVPVWFNWELTGVKDLDPDYYWKYFRSKGHKPLMVVLGECDNPEGHKYVKHLFNHFVQPKKLALIKRSDHYLNTAQSLGLVFYDRAVARQIVDELVSWLDTTRSGGNTLTPQNPSY